MFKSNSTLLKDIRDFLCNLEGKGEDCANPVHVTLCDPPNIMEVETSSLQGCWQDVTTKEKVSIEIVTNEDGTFKSYEIHQAGGTPTTATDLSGYEPCSCPPLKNTGLVTNLQDWN